MLRFVQFVRLVFGLVVEFIQQLFWVVFIKRQFIRLQQRIVQFLGIIFRFVLIVRQQFIGIFE